MTDNYVQTYIHERRFSSPAPAANRLTGEARRPWRYP
jgi:hypothetical protein